MVYGEKYSAYEAGSILEVVTTLSDRYKVRQFSFNDEAVPPKIVKFIGDNFPDSIASGWTFTGLIKFEKYFTKTHFENIYKVGFRSLYVGLESASERVLTLMKKPNKKETIISNLHDATKAGIWMHCFLFFGFPGETEQDAKETLQFMLSNADIIGSFGCGTFSLEHNAPIFKHLDAYGVSLRPSGLEDLDVYYRYRVADGLDAERAYRWVKALNVAAQDIPKYSSIGWVPREHLLCFLSLMRPEVLVQSGLMIKRQGGLPRTTRLKDVFTLVRDLHREGVTIVNRADGRVIELNGLTGVVFEGLYKRNVSARAIKKGNAGFFEALAGRSQTGGTVASLAGEGADAGL
jgi:hypothetical protein